MSRLKNKLSKMEHDDSYTETVVAQQKENDYWTKQVGTTGKTQGQIDAAANAAQVAANTGGTINPTTGHVVPPTVAKPKTITSTTDNGDGTFTEHWSDGSTTTKGTKIEKPKGVTKVSETENTDGTWTVEWSDGSKTLVGQPRNNGLGTGAVNTSGSTLPEGPTDAQLAREDAFKSLEMLFEQYGLGSLAGKIGQYMREGKGPNEATILIKKSDEYKTRFSGNETRAKLGLNVISEAEYIDLENSYAKTLRAYGLSNMMSLDRASNEKKFATYIGADMAADEFAERVGTVSERVMRADPSIKKQFKDFFPSIQDSDLVAYFLSPTEMLPILKEKVTATEIGAAATSQGLKTSLAGATGLAKFGVDRATAVKGYSTISDILPVTSRLGDIYKESKNEYTQSTAEEEVFKGTASAAHKRKNLAELEAGSFSGSAGVSKNSLSRPKI